MGEPLVVSGRGQITLPAALRKRLGLKGGDIVILEDRGSEIVLKPGVVLKVQLYGDEQIAEWDAEDAWAADERDRLVGKLGRGWAPVRINAGDCGGDPDALARLLAPEPARNNGNRSVRTRSSEADTAAW